MPIYFKYSTVIRKSLYIPGHKCLSGYWPVCSGSYGVWNFFI